MSQSPTILSPPADKAAATLTTTVIEARLGWRPIDFGELWHFRDLLFFLALRDIKVRYKQTALGAAWAIIQPVMSMIVFSIFFGKLANLQSKSEIPYPLLTFCALLPWQLFSSAFTQSSNSLIGSQNLITKVYFPRLIIPLSSVISSLVDFAVAFGVLVVLMLWYGVAPHMGILLLPVFVLLALVSALAIGLWLSALNVQYRDVRYTIPFITQLWLFITPVAYPSSIVPEKWRLLYALNPMAGVVEGFRWALLGTSTAPGPMLAVSTVVTVVLLIGGLFYFRRMEKSFADLV